MVSLRTNDRTATLMVKHFGIKARALIRFESEITEYTDSLPVIGVHEHVHLVGERALKKISVQYSKLESYEQGYWKFERINLD